MLSRSPTFHIITRITLLLPQTAAAVHLLSTFAFANKTAFVSQRRGQRYLSTTKMSWMDSWSRPSKHAAVPPPLYITVGEDVPYCRTCGRVMSSRKSNKNNGNNNKNNNNGNDNNVVKYCSDRCRNRKPGPVDKKIERTIVALLNDEEDSGLEKTDARSRVIKGDHRIVVTTDEIEEIVFGSRFDPEKVYGRRKNRAKRGIGGKEGDEWKSVDMVDSSSDSEDDESESEDEGARLTPVPATTTAGGTGAGGGTGNASGPRIRPPQTESDVNFSVGGERGWAERTEETVADVEKRQVGQKRADEREMVRRAARRAVIFGLLVDQPKPDSKTHVKNKKSKSVEPEENEGPVRRKCEAIMRGLVVEPSFAKGNWSIRWRE